MDPYLIYTSFCAIMVCLLGTTGLSSGANCTCPKIPQKNLTSPADGCFGINSRYRYQCIEGYRRKAGTSNLIKCQENSGDLQWTKPTLLCIPIPNYSPKTTTMGPSTSLQSVRTSTSEAAKSPYTEQTALGGDPTTVSMCLSAVILLFLMSSIIFLLYQRRNKPIPPRETEELEPMKC